MVKKLKSYTDSLVLKIARAVPRFHPNFITILGVVPPAMFVWLLVHGYPGWALVALAGTALDSLDGAYARATEQETKFGAVLDSSLDRFSDALIISAFGFAGLVSWQLIIALIISSFLISYIRAAAKGGQDSKILAVGPIERAPRLGIIFIALLLSFIFPDAAFFNVSLLYLVFIILLIGSIVTVWRRLSAAYFS